MTRQLILNNLKNQDMKSNYFYYCVIVILVGLLNFPNPAFPENTGTNGNIYRTISALSCDSLIKANERNPNFVILDVRTPDVWKADHLSGSINRNYYDADFSAQLNGLPKQKMFLLHCQSGARSAGAFTIMKSQNFAIVYEMASGMNAWKSSSLPTTSKMAPRVMLLSNGGTKNGTVKYGVSDTLNMIITNRANDTLKFTSVTLPSGNEFSTNFDLKKKLTGAEDYTFSVFYKPLQLSKDSAQITLSSNGGDLVLSVFLKNGPIQQIQSIENGGPKVYPNPATNFISFDNIPESTLQEISVMNVNGQLVKKELAFPAKERFDVAGLPRGIYIVQVVSMGKKYVFKVVLTK
jgi:rhodanese-related sulfurtransferase